jgi:diguanylate cyclase (GGDEF)-like protein
MPRTRHADSHPDTTGALLSALLELHTASTHAALVDAVANAAEVACAAATAVVLLERSDGALAYQPPASAARRSQLARAIDALGSDIFRSRIDPRSFPAIVEALDTDTVVQCSLQDFVAAPASYRSATVRAELGATHAYTAPIEAAGERSGVLVLLGGANVAPAHVALLAAHAAIARRALGELTPEELPEPDVARSIFDARKLASELERELARARRYNRDISICVIEATNLRLLRERFGPLGGQLMERLGETLAHHARDIDVIGDYKDTGYTMVLTEATAAGVEAAARRLAAEAATVSLEGKPVPGLELHLAVGWATAPADGQTADALFAAAERRMYGDAAQRVA